MGRPRRPKQQLQSPFLSLPPELRNKIYRYALVREDPIDLWPHRWTIPIAAEDSKPTPLNLKVRHQEGLNHVRKEMAVGLLGTCSQMYREAALMFWGENRWRFSGRSGWQGLLRFFLTIGPHARQRIRKLDVHAPIYMRWPVKDSDNKDLNGRSKNLPKMHMVKIPEEGHLDRMAIQRGCALLEQDRTVDEMNFIIPDGFRNGDEDEFGGYDLDHDLESESHDRLLRVQGLDFIKKTIVVEKGGYLAVDDGPAQIMAEGWDVVCLPGSFIWEKGEEDKGGNSDYQKQENTRLRKWHSPARQWDYLEGVKYLFEETEISIHANGGRQKQKEPSLSRSLTAFGGCLFIEDEGIIIRLQEPTPLER
ncbi:uncharacterized protein KY384_003703 [Bacidia gigantensis]|uniref:uncharacterized protein n=1 Tax=Bacidia gigantensis TaxID=2732470 RepID=UPI001D04B9C8|nr:uncharacterized protein KY384_003703 [Bacidia gigantensis]KAG8532066.1 hypothetical protein KY384_003703 [Bacidia gigantensis]